MKTRYLSLTLLGVLFVLPLSADIIKQQSFESAVSDTWGYTTNPGTYYNGHPTYSIWSIDNDGLPAYCLPQDGDWLWNAEYTLNESADIHTMTFNTVDISNYSNLTLSFYYNAFYYGGTGTGKWKGTGDVLGYYVEYDNGSTWSNYTTIVSADGLTNLSGTGGWVNVEINIPEGSDYLRMQFCVKNSEASEVAAFDYITLEGTEVPTPITLSNFAAEVTPAGVELTWETASETENRGFNLYRDNELIAFIPGAGTTSEPHDYSYTDKKVIAGNTYTYMLADISYANIENRFEDNAVSLSTTSENMLIKNYHIGSAYPNPFNPQTRIDLSLNKANHVEVAVFNMKGEKVAELFKGEKAAGAYTLNWNANTGVSGIYFLKISVGDNMETQKLLLVK